ncbi:MAG: UDP-2,3-diacylglucosamine diphosphatase [Burkholderiales bacterium]
MPPSAAAVPPIAELKAPPAWRTVDFISDLHLMPSSIEPVERALYAWFSTESADALFILGDLFEVWVGDDAAEADPFAERCIALLKRAAASMDVFFLHGNRDFLVGAHLMQQCGATLLADPTVLSFAGQRWLLTHGDALCLADTDYMAFRAQVRHPQYQRTFLAKALPERQAIARQMRQQSEARKGSEVEFADVDRDAARQWLLAAQAPVMIHGHTHKPADHDLGGSPAGALLRIVLSDWDAAAVPPRRQVLRLEAGAPGRPRRIDL